MKHIIILPLLLLAATASAQDSTCSSIKQDKQRLACYDKAATATPKKATPTEAKAEASNGFRSHFWSVNEANDPMTDKKSCTAIYKNSWTVQGTANNLFISLRGRGGVRAYTLRFDDAPADTLQLATDTEKELSAVVLGYNFDRAYNGTRLRVQINTLVSGIIVEDIDLAGFKDAVAYIRTKCEGWANPDSKT